MLSFKTSTLLYHLYSFICWIIATRSACTRHTSFSLHHRYHNTHLKCHDIHDGHELANHNRVLVHDDHSHLESVHYPDHHHDRDDHSHLERHHLHDGHKHTWPLAPAVLLFAHAQLSADQ